MLVNEGRNSYNSNTEGSNITGIRRYKFTAEPRSNVLKNPQKSALFKAKPVDPKTYSPLLVGILMGSSKLFLFSNKKLFLFSNKAHLHSSVRLLLELCCVEVMKHVFVFSTICAKLTLAFRLQLLFPDVIVVSDLREILADRRIWQKKARIGGFSHPYSPPSLT